MKSPHEVWMAASWELHLDCRHEKHAAAKAPLRQSTLGTPASLESLPPEPPLEQARVERTRVATASAVRVRDTATSAPSLAGRRLLRLAKEERELVGVLALHLGLEETPGAVVVRVAQQLALGLEPKPGGHQLLFHERLVDAVLASVVARVGVAGPCRGGVVDDGK